MPDPFRDLRAPAEPVDPDPEFARGLRARIERRLARPRGVVHVTAEQSRSRAAAVRIAYRHGDVLHVAHVVPDVERCRAFYAAVLGWTYLPDGRVDGVTPSVGFREGPVPGLIGDYGVADLDVARSAVAAAGGTAGEVERYPWATVAECVDNQGTDFRLHQIVGADGPPPPVNGSGPGDLAYLTLEVADSARARAFYGAVLGWTFYPGRAQDGWAVDAAAPMTGLSGGHPRGVGVPMWLARDLDAAIAAVREQGGVAGGPVAQPYGRMAECTDDQGLRFYLGE